MTRSDDAPLHERLLAEAGSWDARAEASTGNVVAIAYHQRRAADLREAAALLRPPEGEVGALCERLEADAERHAQTGRFVGGSGRTGTETAADIRAALAHLRRLGQVEAAVASLERRVEELDAEREYAWRLATIKEERDRALAPAPTAEPGP